tara:strand:- start:461 stop:715 length:255 start_codon:yes stop_codon:yes gene_type:complete
MPSTLAIDSSARKNTVYEEGVECTPDVLFRSLAGCFGFLLSVVVVTALAIIAAGVFWTAQNIERLTDGNEKKFVQIKILGNMVD